MNIRLSRHAADVMRERGIQPEWLAATLAEPQATERDRNDPQLLHALKSIPEFGGRVLRVVYNPAAQKHTKEHTKGATHKRGQARISTRISTNFQARISVNGEEPFRIPPLQ